MKKIKLSQNLYAIVDDEDFGMLNQFKWSACKQRNTHYATRAIKLADGKWTSIKMHRLIMRTSKGIQIDHINGNGLDNQKKNLRFCSNAENARNRGAQTNSTTKYKGVFWDKYHKKWTARIQVNYKNVFLGYFKNITDAIFAYNQASVNYFGRFAKLNNYKK